MAEIKHICVIGSGYDVHTRNRTQIFAEMGYQVTFITEHPSELEDINEIHLNLPKNRTLNQFWGTLQFVKAIRRIDADVYLVHFPRSHFAWAAAIANVHPLIVSVMGGDVNFDEYGAPLSQFQRTLTLAVLQNSDFILSQTNYLSDVMQDMGIAAAKMDRIIWGIDPQFWYKRNNDELLAIREVLNLGVDDIVLFSPKMLLPFYNIHIIIDALPLILEKFPNVKILVSERRELPEYKQQILSQIEAYDIADHIIFVGDIPHHQMPAYYSLSDAVVTLASNDGLPHAMLEAMACDVPYILGDLPRYREFVQHKEHVYFVDFSAEEVAEAIINLLSDDTLRSQIIEGAHHYVYQFANIRTEAQRVVDIMQNLKDNQLQKSTGIDFGLLVKFVSLGIQQFVNKVLSRR